MCPDISLCCFYSYLYNQNEKRDCLRVTMEMDLGFLGRPRPGPGIFGPLSMVISEFRWQDWRTIDQSSGCL